MAINAGSIYSELILKADKFFQGLDKADRETKSFEGQLKSFGEKSTQVGKSLTTKLTAPIVGVAAAATMLGMEFDYSMSEVSALSGATGEDLQKLEDLAREMGSTTKFSAKDAADGLKYMALAGWSTEQMAAGLEPALILAGAAGMELGLATDIVTDTMSMFGMEAEEATKMTDMLAYAQANSNTDVMGLGEALKYSGAAANAMGYDLADTSALLGIFADQGLKGSAAGTTLNAMFRDMKDKSTKGAIAIGKTNVAIVDSQGNYRDMADIMADVEKATEKMTMAEKDAALGKIFGTQAIKGVNMVLEAGTDTLKDFEKGIRDSDGASKKMYDTMQNNLKGSIDNVKSALEEAGLKIYNALLPSLEKLVGKLQSALDWFNNLDEGTQGTIVKMGLFAASIGPVLLVVGSLAGSISNIIGVAKLATGALGLLGGGATAAAGVGTATGIAGLGGAIGVGAAAFAPWIMGAGSVAGAAYVISKTLKEDTIPSVVLFTDEVSESTQKAIGSFLELEKEATTALKEMAWSGTKVTEEMKESIGGNFAAMKDQVITELDEQKTEAIDNLTKLFSESEAITKEELAKDIAMLETNYEDKKAKTEEGNRRIQEILDKATKEKRKLKESEVKEIETLNGVMKKDAVRILSASEEEQVAILRRLELESGKITATQAADVVKNSKKAKDGAIKEAEEQYMESLKFAESLRREGGAENEAMAKKVEEEAKKQKEAAVFNAERMHSKVVEEAKAQAKEHVEQIDWESGELKSKWNSLMSWFASKPIKRFIETVTKGDGGSSQYDYNPGNNAHGTNYWQGGLTWVGEQGRELVDLPQGSRVLSNPKSEKRAGEGSKIIQNIEIHSPTPMSPSESARKYKQASRQLAAEWDV